MTNEVTTPCGVCNGLKSEHFDVGGNPRTQHAYVPEGGALMTHRQAAEVKASTQRVALPPNTLQYMGNAGASVGRLVEVLREKGVVTDAEALYVAMMGDKPAQPSGYQDPLDPTRS